MRSLILPAMLMAVFLMTSMVGATSQQYPHAAFLKTTRVQNDKISAMKSLNRLHNAVSNSLGATAKHNGMQIQQGTELLAPVSNEPQCSTSEFTTTMFAVFAQCATIVSTTWPLLDSQLKATDAEAQTAWDTFCATTCVTELKTKLSGTNLEICLHPQIKAFLASSIYMCEVKSTSGESCGVQYNRLRRYSSCDGYDSTGCSAASDVCESYTSSGSTIDSFETVSATVGTFTTATAGTKCRSVGSSSVMSSVCDGGCMDGYITKMNSADPSADTVSSLRLLNALICSKADDGEYCNAKMSTFSNALDSGMATDSTFSTFCADRAALKCFRSVGALASKAGVAIVRTGYTACGVAVSNATALVNSQCVPILRNGLAAIRSIGQQISLLCVKNAADGYCVRKIGGLYLNACYNLARYEGTKHTCTSTNASCAATSQAQIADMGCCAGLIQEALTRMYTLTAADYPTLTGYTPVADSFAQIGTTAPLSLGSNEEATEMAGNIGFLADFANCGVTGLNETLRKRCALATKKVEKKLGLKIRWSALSNNAELKAKIQASVKSDVAANLGLAEDNIVDDQLVENSAISVKTTSTTGAAARRGVAIQATESGVDYEFSISAADEETTDEAAASFDTKSSSGDLQMTETQSTTTTECADSCLDSETGVNGLATAETTTTGAASVATLAAVIAALVASLF